MKNKDLNSHIIFYQEQLEVIQSIISERNDSLSKSTPCFSFELPSGEVLTGPAIEWDRTMREIEDQKAQLITIEATLKNLISALGANDLSNAFRLTFQYGKLSEKSASGYFGAKKEALDKAYAARKKQNISLNEKKESLAYLKFISVGTARTLWEQDEHLSLKDCANEVSNEITRQILPAFKGIKELDLDKHMPKSETIRNWIKVFAPDRVRKPGRPKK